MPISFSQLYNSEYTFIFNAVDEKEMSKIHFLTQKDKLLSFNVINRVQKIIDRAAMKFMTR